MIRASKAHLQGAGERYFEHFRFATTFGLLAVAAGVAAIVHALVPALCTSTASRTIRMLGQLLEDRSQLDEIENRMVEMKAFGMLLILATAVSLPLWLTNAPGGLRAVYTALAFSLPFTLLLTSGDQESRPEDLAAVS